jgi:A/G-specific adenine glycosylase
MERLNQKHDFKVQTDELSTELSKARRIGNPDSNQIIMFRELIYDYYNSMGRNLPFRDTSNRYHIFVSEIMLQQTQVSRVVPMYTSFISRFPTLQSLAEADTVSLLAAWQGLGYNRRALFLRRSASYILSECNGKFPDTVEGLMMLPGVGKATAGSLLAFLHNKPSIFIETNIRTVFIYFFFRESDTVDDADIFPLVEVTMDKAEPRAWYYALMDMGVYLKKELKIRNNRSLQYTRQSPFAGSDRKIRGEIVRLYIEKPVISFDELQEIIKEEPERLYRIIHSLVQDGIIEKVKKDRWRVVS